MCLLIGVLTVIIEQNVNLEKGLPLAPDTRELENENLDLSKRHLLVCVNGGGGFIEQKTEVKLHVQFKSQRFTTKEGLK